MYVADATHPVPTLSKKLQALYNLRGGPTIDLTIRKPYTELLAALNNPHKSMPPAIHVAGTNGKGSTIAMLRAIFEETGYNVHTYTSPHLTHFNERIVLAGQEIDDTQLESLLDETVAANNNAPLTFFEITTAMAFSAFARTPADILLLETGLGGRLDCTNVIENPLATIITRIGYDHREFLGGTLTEIAAEKAGIMKPGVPCIIAPQPCLEIDDIFEKRAATLGCPLFKAKTKNPPTTNLTGPHQQDNATTALTCLNHIKSFNIPENAIENGLQNVHWPGRLQRIEWKGLSSGQELWIDGGHNESAGKALAAQAKLWATQDGKELHLIIGMMKTKDPQEFLKPLLPYAKTVTFIDIPHETASYDKEFLEQQLKAKGYKQVSCAESANQAIENKSKNYNCESHILCAGSLYSLSGLINS